METLLLVMSIATLILGFLAFDELLMHGRYVDALVEIIRRITGERA